MEENYMIFEKSIFKKIAAFDYEITKFEQIGINILVLLKIPKEFNYNENIFLINSDGRILWQVEKISHPYEDSPYDNFEIENERIEGFNYDSHTYEIDVHSGKILQKKFTK